MSREHSNLYKKPGLIAEYALDGTKKEQRINPDEIKQHILTATLPDLAADGSSIYDQLSDLLRETNDAQFGIISTLNENGEWVRDATHANPLADRMSHDSPVIEANNTLLRCLSRLRPIDYAIGKNDCVGANTIRADLQSEFANYSLAILNVAQKTGVDDKEKLKQINGLEKEFNTLLVKALHEANLTNGCDNAKDAESLLFHYRNLSSLMEPARTMITLTYDETANVFQRETQYPVTEKTDTQKAAINQLRKIQPHPFEKEKNAHNCRNIATQEADKLFADLMQDDTRALSAQARKTHLVGAKNAFIVKNELIPLGNDALPDDLANLPPVTKENTLWLARSGVPVYVGKGEKSNSIQQHTRENLEQIRIAAQTRMHNPNALNIHVTCLNTYSPLENQNTMVKHLYKATRNNPSKHDNISYAPTNPDGTFRAINLAPGLFPDDNTKPGYTPPLQKKDRLDAVTTIMLQAAKQKDSISLVQCASGQDRTGTAVEKAIQEWMKQRYDDQFLSKKNIETMRAQGGNAAEITSHHIHGSPGMKTDSIVNNFFGSKKAFADEISEQFYLKSAKTNKTNHIDEEGIAFLQTPSPVAIAEYEANLAKFESSLANYEKTIGNDENKQKFHDMGLNVLKNIKQIAGDNPGALDSKGLADLNTVLPHSNTILDKPDIKTPEAQESLRRLASLSNKVSGKAPSLWKTLGVGLLTFACLALVVGGILAAIPSGGSSLLLTVAGAAGLGGGLLAASAIGVGAGALYGREKGLAKSLTNFKSALEHIKEEEPSTKSYYSSPMI